MAQQLLVLLQVLRQALLRAQAPHLAHHVLVVQVVVLAIQLSLLVLLRRASHLLPAHVQTSKIPRPRQLLKAARPHWDYPLLVRQARQAPAEVALVVVQAVLAQVRALQVQRPLQQRQRLQHRPLTSSN